MNRRNSTPPYRPPILSLVVGHSPPALGSTAACGFLFVCHSLPLDPGAEHAARAIAGAAP